MPIAIVQLQCFDISNTMDKLLFVTFTLSIVVSVECQCPSKSIFVNNKCYSLIESDDDWFGAEKKCQQQYNGHLAKIENELEKTAVEGN